MNILFLWVSFFSSFMFVVTKVELLLLFQQVLDGFFKYRHILAIVFRSV